MQIYFGNVAKSYAKYRNDLPKELMESSLSWLTIFDEDKRINIFEEIYTYL